MIRWMLYLPLKVLAFIVAMLLAPVLPAFAEHNLGPVDNANGSAVEPRLPGWLSWFQTPDNSLWGDAGWRTKHRPGEWQSQPRALYQFGPKVG